MRTLAYASVIGFLLCVAFAQEARAPREFEVASVKRNTSGETRGGVRTDPERLTGTNATVKQLVLFAYDLPDYRVSGPPWMETERYDVTAKSSGSVDTDQLRRMLQTLLADRFHLASHRETKVVPVYWLIAAKNGPKVRRLVDGDQSPSLRPGINAIYLKATAPQFAERLSRYLARPVLDKTGLDGRFFFQLEWGLDSTPTGGAAPVRDLSDSGASLFTAVQEQLGLKLESHKSEVEFLVIDSVQRPSENE